VIGYALLASALAADVEVGAAVRYSTMLDNLIGLAVVTESPTMRPAGPEVYGMACEILCLGATAELFLWGGHASLLAATVSRPVTLGPVLLRPEIGLGGAYYGRKSLVPVISGRNTSALIRVGLSLQPDTPGAFRPLFDLSWDTHPILPAISLRRGHDLRVGLGVAFRGQRRPSALGDVEGEGADP